MSELVFAANADPWGWGGFEGPDPVTAADAGWTWDVEFGSSSEQTTYARSSLNSVGPSSGTFWVVSGVVQYRTKDFFGAVHLHQVGKSDPDGVVDFINESWVESLTFGWTFGAFGEVFGDAKINFEVWVS